MNHHHHPHCVLSERGPFLAVCTLVASLCQIIYFALTKGFAPSNIGSSENQDAINARVDQLCQLNATTSSDYEFYRAVHSARFPACTAGTWIYQPDLVVRPSEEHLVCLDRERQGNCHDLNSWINTTDGQKLARHNSILNNAVRNSPGILNGSDPWVWYSDLKQYKTVPYHKITKKNIASDYENSFSIQKVERSTLLETVSRGNGSLQ